MTTFPARFRKVQVTILASEWGSSKGGLSTINREIAIQLAKCPEAEITFFLPKCSKEDKKLALQNNVKIVEALRRPGFQELEWLSFPSDHLQIDVSLVMELNSANKHKSLKNVRTANGSKSCTQTQKNWECLRTIPTPFPRVKRNIKQR